MEIRDSMTFLTGIRQVNKLEEKVPKKSIILSKEESQKMSIVLDPQKSRFLTVSPDVSDVKKALVDIKATLLSQIMHNMTMFFASRPSKDRRMWAGVVKKLIVEDHFKAYFNNFYVRPGVDFLRALANTHYDIRRVQLNIPDTLVFNEYLYCLYTDSEGYLAREPYLGKQLFLERADRRAYNRETSNIYLGFQGKGYDSYFTDYDVFHYHALTQGGEGDIAGSYHQQIIIPSNRNNMSMYRFFLTKGKASYAWYIQNEVYINDLEYHVNQRYNISLLDPLAFKIRKMTGGCLLRMEDEALKIRKLMGDAFGFRLTHLVVDFIKDTQGKYWFRSLHSFTVDNMVIPKDDQLKFLLYSKEVPNMSKLCPLCLIKFKPNEVNKPSTNKLIMRARNHMIQRGIHIFDHFNIQSYSTLCHNQSICDLCYTLVVKEWQLLETERKFAKVQNINTGQEMIKVECRKEAELRHQNLVRPPLVKKNLFQWRIMFYFQIINDVPKGLFQNNLKYYLHYKILNQAVSIKMYMNKIDLQRKSTDCREMMTSALVIYILDLIKTKRTYQHKYIPLDILKMHFFFTQEEDDPHEFLKNLHLFFRITDSPEGTTNRDILKGESKIFQPIIHPNEIGGGDYMRLPLTFQQNINLFTKDRDQFVSLKMVVGIVKDIPEMDTSGLNIYGNFPVFHSDDSFYSHQPFPDSFIDVFHGYLDRQKEEVEREIRMKEADKVANVLKERERKSPRFKSQNSIIGESPYVSGIFHRSNSKSPIFYEPQHEERKLGRKLPQREKSKVHSNSTIRPKSAGGGYRTKSQNISIYGEDSRIEGNDYIQGAYNRDTSQDITGRTTEDSTKTNIFDLVKSNSNSRPKKRGPKTKLKSLNTISPQLLNGDLYIQNEINKTMDESYHLPLKSPSYSANERERGYYSAKYIKRKTRPNRPQSAIGNPRLLERKIRANINSNLSKGSGERMKLISLKGVDSNFSSISSPYLSLPHEIVKWRAKPPTPKLRYKRKKYKLQKKGKSFSINQTQININSEDKYYPPALNL